ncbi:MAG: hypothetical protein OET44_11540 [Gammaproteobacteria bacterium]|nr:hypothetical protein [Gammaproteobacteria bacterium]
MELKLLILIVASLLPQPDPPTCEERGGKRVLWRMDRIEQPGKVIQMPVYKCAHLSDAR